MPKEASLAAQIFDAAGGTTLRRAMFGSRTGMVNGQLEYKEDIKLKAIGRSSEIHNLSGQMAGMVMVALVSRL